MGKIRPGKDNGAVKQMYEEAVEKLKEVAGGDWAGPAHPPERVEDALDSTKGLDTDTLRKKARDLADAGRPVAIKAKGILEESGKFLLGFIGGQIADHLVEKVLEWWRSDEKTQEYRDQVKECADRVDDAEQTTCEQAEKMCTSTNEQITALCQVLRSIDRDKEPELYCEVLSSADALINECGGAVIDLARERDRCISDCYNIIIQCGAQICGLRRAHPTRRLIDAPYPGTRFAVPGTYVTGFGYHS